MQVSTSLFINKSFILIIVILLTNTLNQNKYEYKNDKNKLSYIKYNKIVLVGIRIKTIFLKMFMSIVF